MQIREVSLQELDIAYNVIKELRTELSYDEYETLIYQMQESHYKIFAVFERDELITYAGVAISTNLYHKRHLFIYDLVTKSTHRSKGYGKEMLIYLHDYAKMFTCEYLILSSGFQRLQAHQFYAREGFEKKSAVLVKSL